MGKVFKDKPSLANSVRVVNLTISYDLNKWLFNDPNFINISQLLAKSPRPPHKLKISGATRPFTFKDPIHIVGQLLQTSFSQTLTVLHLTQCWDVPLTLFLACPNLKEVKMQYVDATEESYDKCPDAQCSGRELPTLDILDYRDSANLVKQMIFPPSKFRTSVVLWSKLRVLALSPHEVDDMACVQPILNAACNTLEELYLTKLRLDRNMNYDHLSLAGLVNLKNLSCLHVFELYAKCVAGGSGVLHDINHVLSTIPRSNQVTKLAFDFCVSGKRPFRGCLEENWVGLCDQIIRISGGKQLELDISIRVTWSGQEELRKRIGEKITSLSEYPNICTHFNNLARFDSEVFRRVIL